MYHANVKLYYLLTDVHVSAQLARTVNVTGVKRPRVEPATFRLRVRYWRRAVVVNALVSINEVAIRRARLLLGWVTTDKPSCYVTNHVGQLSLHPSGVWLGLRPGALCRVAGNTVRSHMVSDAP